MEMQFAIDIARIALWNALMISLAPLGAGMVIGMAISILQTATQIQEQTLTFVPKIVGLIVVLLFLGPWILQRLVSFTYRMWDLMVKVGGI